MKGSRSRPTIVRFNKSYVKSSILRQKRNIGKDLGERKVSLFEGFTKIRRIKLSVVQDRFKSAHTSCRTVCFYRMDSHVGGDKLVYVKKKPYYLFEHGFDIEDISKRDRALMDKAR